MTGAIITGTRRKVKVERIPFMSPAVAADSLLAQPTKENHPNSAKTAETATSTENTSQASSETLPSSLSSDSSLPTQHSKTVSKTENILPLTAEVQDMVQSGTAKIQKEDLSSFVSGREITECTEQPSRTEEQSSRISLTLNCEVEDGHTEAITDAKPQRNEPQVHSASATKAVSTAAQMDCKSSSHSDGVELAVAVSRRPDMCGKTKPKLIKIRCPTDEPDHNCKTQ